MIAVPKPPPLQFMLKAALHDRMLCELAHVHSAEPVDLRGHGIFFNQGLFGKRELQWVICRQGDVEPSLQILGERISVVREKERIIAQRRHCNADLVEIEDVLQKRHLSEHETMAYAVTAQYCSGKMVNIPRLATMRAQEEGIEATTLTPRIQRGHIREQIINPVGIRRVLLGIPFFRWREFAVQARLDLALIIDTVESNDTL